MHWPYFVSHNHKAYPPVAVLMSLSMYMVVCVLCVVSVSGWCLYHFDLKWICFCCCCAHAMHGRWAFYLVFSHFRKKNMLQPFMVFFLLLLRFFAGSRWNEERRKPRELFSFFYAEEYERHRNSSFPTRLLRWDVRFQLLGSSETRIKGISIDYKWIMFISYAIFIIEKTQRFTGFSSKINMQ